MVLSLLVAVTKAPIAKESLSINTILETGLYDSKECNICVSEPTSDFIVLWGDSHSVMLNHTMQKVAADKGLQLVQLISKLHFDQTRLLGLAKHKNFRGVFMAGRWSMYAVGFFDFEVEEYGHPFLSYGGKKAENLEEARRNFQANLTDFVHVMDGKSIMLMAQVPQYPFFPKKDALMEAAGFKVRPFPEKSILAHRADHAVVNNIFSELASRYKNVLLADPAEVLCVTGQCNWRVGNRLLYKDDDHLSVYGASYIAPFLSMQVDRLTAKSRMSKNVD